MIYSALIIMTLLGSFASLFLKLASTSNGIVQLLKNYNLYLGAFLYFISALLNIVILKYLDYSIVLPLTSITYIWTLIISNKILKEKITSIKVLGIICIVIGTLAIVQ